MGDAGDHMGVGDHQAGADHEARTLLDLPTAVTHDLDGGAAGVGHRLLQLGVRRAAAPGRRRPGPAGRTTGGNPSDDRKLCTRENTDGGAGSTASRERMIRDRSIEALRLSEELLTSVLANSQTASSEATTATPTPSAESTDPRSPRCTVGEGEVAHDPAGHAARGWPRPAS